MVLVYMDARSYTSAEFMWDEEKFQWLIAYRDSQGKIIDFLFDGFLLIGYVWKNNRYLLPISGGDASDKTDWKEFLNLQFEVGVLNLNGAVENVSQSLGDAHYAVKVVLTIPYPDPKQSNFGEVSGVNRDFRNSGDRVAAVKWYIDEALDKWADYHDRGLLERTELVGFYWLHETVPQGDETMIKEISDYLHGKGYLLFWIPYFRASGVTNWKEIGFDAVTMQPNYAFYDSGVERFEQTANMCVQYRMGVEMELPLYKRNPRIADWKESFKAYMDAAVKYRFMWAAMLTYYYGNAFVTMATTPDIREFYEKIYWFVKGTYPNPP